MHKSKCQFYSFFEKEYQRIKDKKENRFGFAKKLRTILTNIHLMNLVHRDDNTDGTIMIQGREKDQLTSYIHSFLGMFLQNGLPQDKRYINTVTSP